MTPDLSQLPHQLVLDDRRQLSVSGVSEVDSFDDQAIVAHTTRGDLTVRGDDLHILHLNTESGELSLEGHIRSLEYTEPQPRGNRLKRWFK